MNELELVVSPVCHKDGQAFAFVQFTDKDRTAEGKIPMCEIVMNQGFSKDEVAKLEDYMKKNLTKLKELAAKQNPFNALFKG